MEETRYLLVLTLFLWIFKNIMEATRENNDPSTMSSQADSDLINYIDYDSPLLPININQHFSTLESTFLPPYYPFPQYLPQPPLSYLPTLDDHNNFRTTGYPPAQPPSYMPSIENDFHMTYYPQMPQELYRYEDFLDLQEQIGRVNVGLSEETISKNLKTSPTDVSNKDKEEGGEICVVCLDEYKVKETIGTLPCGHCYHANCIKEWLLQKNVCPICKATTFVT